MTTPFIIKCTVQEAQSIRFFGELKRNLGFASTQRMVKLIRIVLTQVRGSLSHEQASEVLKNLPGLFQLLFVANWKYEEGDTSVKHLDELVDNIYQQDQKTPDSLFTSEIDALNKVIPVLNKLQKFFGILGLTVFRYSISQELKQAAIEETV